MAIDWNDLIRRLRAYLMKHAWSLRADLDDLEGDILAELAQKVEEGEVEDPARMLYSIARFRITDRLRRRQKRAEREHDPGSEGFDPAGPEGEPGELLYSESERSSLLAFHIREFFLHRLKQEECARLAERVLERYDWQSIADESASEGASAQTLKKRWSRCLNRLKEAFSGDLDDLLFGAFARGSA